MPGANDLEKLYTPEEVAEHCKVSVYTVKNWLRQGLLPGIKLGRRWRVRQKDLEEWIRSR